MSALFRFLRGLFIVALVTCLVQSDDDEDVKGPIMLKNEDGTLMNTKQQIDARKYKGEAHTVTTDDGYVLTLYRVTPAKLPASAVLVQHGLLGSSDFWVTDKKSLAFTLSDAGYDVWLSNSRGNYYSRNHTKLNPDKDKSFWNYSWHEMGMKDIPAVVDYILKTTSQPKIHYIGHSMGTTMAFITLSLKPEYNNKFKSLVAFSPIAMVSKMAEMVGPDGMAEAMATKYMDQFKAADKWEVFPRTDVKNNSATQVTCDDVDENFQDMCKDKMESAHEILGGPYFPAGQSMKTFYHFHQMFSTGVMKYYKFDTPEENEKIYGCKEPPSYTDHFKSITTPTVLWSCDNDGMTVPEDMDNLKPKMGNVIADNRIPDECFDHVTFGFPRKVVCLPVREKFYKDLLETLKKLD